MHKTSSEINIPLHIGKDLYKNLEIRAGEFPYVRGIHSSMYRDRLWTMRQYAGFSTAKETNSRFQELLSKGAKGLSCAFDLPTQMGYDSDDEMALGEVGKVGVAIDTIDDMRELFDGIDQSQVSTSMTINSTASILLSMYEVIAEEKKINPKKLSGTIQNDILKEYIARGTYIYPPAPSLRIVTDIFKYCSENLPRWNTISISGYHIREAGSTAAQEVAFTLSNAKTYVQAALDAGLDIDVFAPRLSFFFNVHNNFMEEIAKFRAARKIWALMMRDHFKAQNEKSWKLRFHSQVAGSTLTAQQPLNNIVRVTMQAMAAVIGGTQSLHTNAYDEALQLPTSESAQIALRTQQIIANESGLTDFVDAMGGAHAIEYLTEQLEAKANEYMESIELQGGVIKCINNGYIVGEIGDASYKAQLKIESGEDKIVGLNCHLESSESNVPSNKISQQVEKGQVEKLKLIKKNRNSKHAEKSLSDLKKAAHGTENLMPYVKACVKNKCSLGEISKTLKNVFGTFQQSPGA